MTPDGLRDLGQPAESGVRVTSPRLFSGMAFMTETLAKIISYPFNPVAVKTWV